ncbi:hypothetical protein M0R45_006663 [Rubus argutus]|uniref:Uncharacterized protein n=1 Tax=Rubus argutus TaxID=59490 RepID=A0AAW1YRT5_RUBAR
MPNSSSHVLWFLPPPRARARCSSADVNAQIRGAVNPVATNNHVATSTIAAITVAAAHRRRPCPSQLYHITQSNTQGRDAAVEPVPTAALP